MIELLSVVNTYICTVHLTVCSYYVTYAFYNECTLYPHSVIWLVGLNGQVFVYELSGCGFESSCSHLNFRFRACFEQGVP